MFLEDEIMRTSSPTISFKLIVNNKFYVTIIPNRFYKNKYKDILKKYMFLFIVDRQYEKLYNYKTKKLYVQSESLEKELLDFENEWYNSQK